MMNVKKNCWLKQCPHIIEAEEQAEKDVLAEREASLARELAAMRSRKRKLADPLQYALSIAVEMSRADWITVGMALKEEGSPCSIWDDWSRNDPRYHAGECEWNIVSE